MKSRDVDDWVGVLLAGVFLLIVASLTFCMIWAVVTA